MKRRNMFPFVTTYAMILALNAGNSFAQENLTDTVAPVIEGVEDGKIYCREQTVQIIEDHLAEVTVNDEPVTLTEDGFFTISPAPEIQTITAIDEAGNTTSIDIVVNSEHIYDENMSCLVCGQGLSEDAENTTSNQEELKNVLMASSNTELVFGKQIKRDTIKSVEILNTLSSADDSAWDASKDEDRSVLAWITTDNEGWNHLYLAADGDLAANENCAALFKDYSNLEEIKGLEYLNTSNATNMSSMFHGCASLLNLNLDHFDTSNVTDMSYMFRGCASLQDLNVETFDTSSVTNMDNMFRECASLEKLDVNSFDTGNVTNMKSVFNSCMNLHELQLDSFDTRNVTDMSYMFYECVNLETLQLTNFNTSKVVNMQSMFYDCMNLQELNLTGFDTRNVTDMSYMFVNCSSLKALDLSSFNTDKVTDMSHAFDNCANLEELNFGTR